MLSAHNTPDLRPIASQTPLSNGHMFNQLKRTLSQDAESSMNEDMDDANGRRSKRLKKGKLSPTCRYLQLAPPAVTTWVVASSAARMCVRCSSDWVFDSLTSSVTDAAPTVAGSHMTQPRQSTPGSTFYPRARAADERPGDVSVMLCEEETLY